MRRSDCGFFVVCVRRTGLKAPHWTQRRIEFGVYRAGEVAADIVAPIAVADVSGGGGEVRFEGEHGPCGVGVAGETDFVAMIAEAAPAMEQQRALALALHIGEVDVVEPPRGAEIFHAGGVLLLPIEPEEIHALLFERMVQDVHIVGGEFLVGDVKGHILLVAGSMPMARAISG